uniref:Uncharacterized protein n=1 Tax=Parascaris equorum TaxID=6256 RepID=A0A914RXP3_PAREQ
MFMFFRSVMLFRSIIAKYHSGEPKIGIIYWCIRCFSICAWVRCFDCLHLLFFLPSRLYLFLATLGALAVSFFSCSYCS